MSKRTRGNDQLIALVSSNDLPFTLMHSDGRVESLHRSLQSAQIAALHLLTSSGSAMVRTPDGATHTFTVTVKERYKFFSEERQAV